MPFQKAVFEEIIRATANFLVKHDIKEADKDLTEKINVFVPQLEDKNGRIFDFGTGNCGEIKMRLRYDDIPNWPMPIYLYADLTEAQKQVWLWGMKSAYPEGFHFVVGSIDHIRNYELIIASNQLETGWHEPEYLNEFFDALELDERIHRKDWKFYPSHGKITVEGEFTEVVCMKINWRGIYSMACDKVYENCCDANFGGKRFPTEIVSELYRIVGVDKLIDYLRKNGQIISIVIYDNEIIFKIKDA